MMSATIRRKALALCSNAVANNGIAERTQAALSRGYVAGFEGFGRRSNLLPEYQQENAEIEKKVNSWVHTSPAYFTASGAVVGIAAPIANAPQAAKLGMGSSVSTTLLPNLALFWHINNGMEEILADYVHHEMTRSLVLVMMRLFLIVAAKDVFVATPKPFSVFDVTQNKQ